VKDKPAFVLDSYAVLAHYQNEPGGPRVKAVLAQAEKHRADVYLSIINYGEAIYILEREEGLSVAQDLIATIDQLPITVVEANRRLTFAAAHLKARHAVSYADAFACALAQQTEAALLTGDPEFRKVESLVTVEWLPTA
jgi:predicted nucleic acid-binding protein